MVKKGPVPVPIPSLSITLVAAYPPHFPKRLRGSPVGADQRFPLLRSDGGDFSRVIAGQGANHPFNEQPYRAVVQVENRAFGTKGKFGLEFRFPSLIM